MANSDESVSIEVLEAAQEAFEIVNNGIPSVIATNNSFLSLDADSIMPSLSDIQRIVDENKQLKDRIRESNVAIEESTMLIRKQQSEIINGRQEIKKLKQNIIQLQTNESDTQFVLKNVTVHAKQEIAGYKEKCNNAEIKCEALKLEIETLKKEQVAKAALQDAINENFERERKFLQDKLKDIEKINDDLKISQELNKQFAEKEKSMEEILEGNSKKIEELESQLQISHLKNAELQKRLSTTKQELKLSKDTSARAIQTADEAQAEISRISANYNGYMDSQQSRQESPELGEPPSSKRASLMKKNSKQEPEVEEAKFQRSHSEADVKEKVEDTKKGLARHHSVNTERRSMASETRRVPNTTVDDDLGQGLTIRPSYPCRVCLDCHHSINIDCNKDCNK